MKKNCNNILRTSRFCSVLGPGVERRGSERSQKFIFICCDLEMRNFWRWGSGINVFEFGRNYILHSLIKGCRIKSQAERIKKPDSSTTEDRIQCFERVLQLTLLLFLSLSSLSFSLPLAGIGNLMKVHRMFYW